MHFSMWRPPMRAMVLQVPGQPLVADDVPIQRLPAGHVLIRVAACAVCRIDLHVVDGELPDPNVPLIPGHESSVALKSLAKA